METDVQQERTPYSQLKSRYAESPIHLIEYSRGKAKALDNELIEVTQMKKSTIGRITELNGEDGLAHENEDVALFDVFGNAITPVLSEFQLETSEKEESEKEVIVKEDKENEIPLLSLTTPLKVRNVRANPSRSALLDITPTAVTHRKTKAKANYNSDMKNQKLFMTPKTMAESRNQGGSNHLKCSRM